MFETLNLTAGKPLIALATYSGWLPVVVCEIDLLDKFHQQNNAACSLCLKPMYNKIKKRERNKEKVQWNEA